MSHPNSEQTVSTAPTSIDGLAHQFIHKIFGLDRESHGHKKPDAVKLPWETWELDDNFFRSLSRWTLQNPETSLDRILNNVSDALEDSRDFFEAIPDSPFPARSLVIALGHLFKLGVTISRAKEDVQEFAKDVVRWVGQVKVAFEGSKQGHFTWLAWRDLRQMRDLIDEICSWAVKRLHDGRWSRIGHGLTIQKEIREFNEQIADARALFQDLSAINMARGLDAILHDLRKILQRQRTISVEIQKIRETQEKQLGRILNEIELQKQVAERDRFFAQTLNVRAVANPTYDSQGKRPCDEDTRKEILGEIRKWANDISPGMPNFLWLTGDPGCGKSAVTASLARECKDQGVLWAQFFINRNNSETTDPRSYFPSIARQLADYSPEVAETIHQTLGKQRSLVDDISADQAAKLFANSIRKASQLDPGRPVVVVIDGLDETSRERLEDTARIFSTLFTSLQAHGNAKVFISSRTENEIQKSFVLPFKNTYVKHVHLDTAHPSSIRDVSHYIKRNLLDLVKEHDLNWDVWPGDKRSRALGERAAGLFIWAVTAVKFIQERLQTDGQECLNDVLDLLTADVLHDINALYMLILTVMHGTHPSDWELERFRRIVGAIVSLREPLCIDDLAALLDLRKTPSSSPVDIPHFVRRFRTILVTGTDVISGTTIPRIHKSVFEFITSDVVDARFRVEPDHAHLELGMQCLVQLGAARVSEFKDELPSSFRYASRFWSSHLSQVRVTTSKFACVDYRHSQSPSLLSISLKPTLSTKMPVRIHSSPTKSRIITMFGDHIKAYNALSGAYLTGHAENVSCVVFSPSGNAIVSCSTDQTIRVWNPTNGRFKSTLVNYTSPVYAIAFSPDGKTIVSGSHDGLVCLWDSTTGAPIGHPFTGHSSPVKCVSFSPNGERLISGANAHDCILWDVQKGQMIGKPWTDHRYSVKLVTFSDSGRQICSRDVSGLCIIWDANNRKIVSRWNYDGMVTCMSFLPNNDDVLVMGGKFGITVRSSTGNWDSSIPDSRDILGMSFSFDGREIMFGTSDSICVARFDKEMREARIIKKQNYDGRRHARSLAFSQDLECFACADKNVHVYAVQGSETSLDIISADEPMPTIEANGGDEKLMDALSELKEAQRNISNHSRLSTIKWYLGKVGGGAESVVKLCVVTEDAVVAAYQNDIVSVWRHTGLGHGEE